MTDPFHVRFDIDVPIEDACKRFINRIENGILKIATALAHDGRNFSINMLEPLSIEVETALGEPHLTFVSSPGIFVEVWRNRVNGEFLRCLRAIEGFSHALSVGEGLPSYSTTSGAERLNSLVTETLDQSETDLGISWHGGFFSKKGAELLDDNLVNKSLRWLADPKYQNVLVPFQKGLSHLLEGTKDPQRFGDAVTDMYESLEAMAKIVVGKPTKDLSALREEFVAKLRLPATHKEMLKQYIDYGCDFRHALETGQKRMWPLEHEAENFVYLTDLFIRLAIQAEKT